MMRFSRLALGLMAALVATPALAIDIDGKVNADEWQGATHVTDFKQVQPETLADAKYRTEAWYLPTPKGMAVAIRNYQPAEVKRTRTKSRRDEGGQYDRNNVFIDFDGNGVQAYEFTVSIANGLSDGVITGENQFREDWDGDVQHATSETDEYWDMEILIPWHVATMNKAKDGKRTIGVYFDRVIGATGERFAAPGISFNRTPFTSSFRKAEIPSYSQSLFAVTPYATALYDNIRNSGHYKAGADIYWKPSGQFQLSATVNPDFGQVESDGIVINFSADETFYGDKRPFFTENQGIYDFSLLNDNSQLFYTRRVGGRSDDGSGPAEIDAAAKINGAIGKLNYGVFAAQERGDGGRSYQALRTMYAMPTQTWGAMLTHVDRPFLDRDAFVYAVDHKWKPNDALSVNSTVAVSDIDDSGSSTRGNSVTSHLTWNPSKEWSHQLLAMYFDRDFDPNDMGYLGRNNMKWGHVQSRRTWSNFAQGSTVTSVNLSGRLFMGENMDGLRLNGGVRVQASGSLRDGGEYYSQYEHNLPRFDDRLTRGGHPLKMPGRDKINVEISGGRHGKWQPRIGVFAAGDALMGNDGWYWSAWTGAKYYFNDRVNLDVGVSVDDSPDALIWDHGNQVGRYRMRTAVVGSTFNWDMSARSDLRIKLEAVGLKAAGREWIDVLPNGGYAALPGGPESFRLNQMGFQLRYRYELAPLSNLYVVYGRGGYSQFNDESNDHWSMLRDSRRLHNDEQLVVKVSYRFSN